MRDGRAPAAAAVHADPGAHGAPGHPRSGDPGRRRGRRAGGPAARGLIQVRCRRVPGRADTYLEIVAVPDFASAMRKSEHPVTADFAERMQEVTEGEASFRNLDVAEVLRM